MLRAVEEKCVTDADYRADMVSADKVLPRTDLYLVGAGVRWMESLVTLVVVEHWSEC